MKTRIRLRVHIVAALTIAAALTTFPALHRPSAQASESRRTSTVSSILCPYRWKEGAWQVKHLIRCAARRWHVAGGPDKALSVARCESHFHPRSYNPAGYAGVFQQATRYWPDRSDRYGFPNWSVYNGRANVMVSIKMAHRFGWGGWSCA